MKKPPRAFTQEEIDGLNEKYKDYENKWECDFCFTRMPNTENACSFCKKERGHHYVNEMALRAKKAIRESLANSRTVKNIKARQTQLDTTTYPLLLGLKLNDGQPPPSDAEFKTLLKATYDRWPGKQTYSEREFALAMMRCTFNTAEHMCEVNRVTTMRMMNRLPSALQNHVKPVATTHGAGTLKTLLDMDNKMQLAEIGAFSVMRPMSTASDFFINDLSGERPEVVEGVVKGELVGQPHIQVLAQLAKVKDEFENVTIGDMQIAINQCGGNFEACKAYLKVKCPFCRDTFPRHKMHRGKAVCECLICFGCYDANLKKNIQQRAPCNWRCGGCRQPDNVLKDDRPLKKLFEEMRDRLHEAPDFSQSIRDLFNEKVKDYELSKDPNAAVCPKCNYCQISKSPDNRVRCNRQQCGAEFCRKCNFEWHQGKTCLENFRTIHPDMECIQCPKCSTFVEKVLGRCEHFDCLNTSCGASFCPCGVRFYQGSECEAFGDRCASLGFHGHHPRNCFTDLRNMQVVDLQRLITEHSLSYNKTCAQTRTCTILIMQKNNTEGPCGVAVYQNGLDVCERHYIAFLSTIVQKNELDPLEVMTTEDIVVLSQRQGIHLRLPDKQGNEANEAYRKRIIQFMKSRWPLSSQFPN